MRKPCLLCEILSSAAEVAGELYLLRDGSGIAVFGQDSGNHLDRRNRSMQNTAICLPTGQDGFRSMGQPIMSEELLLESSAPAPEGSVPRAPGASPAYKAFRNGTHRIMPPAV